MHLVHGILAAAGSLLQHAPRVVTACLALLPTPLPPPAINRLDGRQYAVKKIPLDAHSAGAYARIMREVTTLSRLQHINVVRYFQVCCCTVRLRVGRLRGW